MPWSLTISCSSKSRLVLTFLVLPSWYLLTRVVPDIFQKSSKTVVCVCVAASLLLAYSGMHETKLLQPTMVHCLMAWSLCKVLRCVCESKNIYHMPYALPAAQPTASKHWRQWEGKPKKNLFRLFRPAFWLPPVLWRCWLGSRKGIRPVKTWVVGCWHGYLSGARCICIWPNDAAFIHYCISRSSKSQLILPFWYWLTSVILDKVHGAVKTVAVVVVYVLSIFLHTFSCNIIQVCCSICSILCYMHEGFNFHTSILCCSCVGKVTGTHQWTY